ncbi:MAG: MBL fold metallo-hydrolase [Actinobacteria bacterium]|nr:MBL fold metallo-hydrolase [Actinomycetota bacterium]
MTVEPDATLREVGDGVFAYLQDRATWGYSNAGLVRGYGESALVDTLFDLRLTRAMLDAMAPITAAGAITTVVNTHANGDHCYGNQLVTGARVVTSSASAAEMDDVTPAALHAFKQLDLGEDGNRYVADAFGPFRFDDIEPVRATDTFDGSVALDVGATRVELEEVGPAHTRGDVIAWVPEARVVFTGDILFIGSTPIIWSGPVGNWLAACRRINKLDALAVVPGHGPVTDADGVQQVAGYLEWLRREVGKRRDAGMDAMDAAWDVELGEYAHWADAERIVINVDAVYAELDARHRRLNVVDAFREMGRYRAGH